MPRALRVAQHGLLVALVAAVAYLLGRETAPPPAFAYRDVDHNRDMIAVTGQYGTGTSVLYLIDTRTRHLLVYEARGGTMSDLRLLATREITYDLKVRSYNDVSEPRMKVAELERQWRAFAGPEPRGQATGPGPAKPPKERHPRQGEPRGPKKEGKRSPAPSGPRR